VAEGSNKVLEDALRLERMGIFLLPIDPVEKRPFRNLLPRDEKGYPRWKPLRETPATAEQIENWFWRYEDFNIAIITGQPSRLAVLDIDGPTPPDLPELPDTVVEKTPREEGGYHYYFRVDEYQPSDKYKWNEDGVDYQCEIKAELVYVICSPSSYGGRTYEWLPGKSLLEREPAPLPPELIAYLESKDARATRRESMIRRERTAGTTEAAVRMEDLQWYEKLKYDEDVAIQILQHCGADVEVIGETFLCPLPGHDERSPSASLYPNRSGEIIFHDWHARDKHEWYSLANVYALWSSEKQGLYFTSDNVMCHERWWARALYESGFIDRPLPTLALKQELLPVGDEDVPDCAQIVYEAVCYITQLEELLYGKLRGESDNMIEFPSRFAITWRSLNKPTCMSPNTYTGGIKWLKEQGYLEVREMDDMFVMASSRDAARRSRTFVTLTKPR